MAHVQQTDTFLHPRKSHQSHEKARLHYYIYYYCTIVYLLLCSSAHPGKCLKEKPRCAVFGYLCGMRTPTMANLKASEH